MGSHTGFRILRFAAPIHLAGALVLAPMLAITVAPIQATAETFQPTEVSLLSAEDALFKADVEGDAAVIQQGFADEAVFVHANGMSQNKADYLKATTAHAFPIKSVEGENRTARVFGTIGVVSGTKTLIVGDMHLSGTYLTVYVWRDGRWQMLNEQSSPMPAAQKPQAPK